MKEKMDAIYKAFESYIRKNKYFDIVRSEKFGYVWITKQDDGLVKFFNSPEAMLENIIREIADDVMFSPNNPVKEHYSLALSEYEETETRRRVTAILETMENDEDRARAFRVLEKYLKKAKKPVTLQWDDDR